MAEPDFWADISVAKRTSQKCESLRQELQRWEHLKNEVNEIWGLASLSEKESDESLDQEVSKKFEALTKRFRELEFFVLFSNKYDKNDAIVAIHAGTGGTEAQDWAAMLSRMLLRYCEKKGFQYRIIDESRGQEAGIKSMTFMVSGRYAYGYLKSENGVHRLVRISPFDAEKMRHTSFALIEVLPEIGDVKDIALEEEDLKIDVFRSSGHGGQSVNTTDSAVRITHIPTGITVKCQNERSQHQNKETALRHLRAKLLALQEAGQEEEKRKLRGEYTSAEWGNQIRSYVLQPYKMVKDHRTDWSEPDSQAVLDGKLEGFVEAYLRLTAKEEQKTRTQRE